MIKKIFINLGYLFSFIYPKRISWSLGFIRSLIYTGWKKRAFKKMEGFINYPIGTGGEKYISVGKNSVIGKNSHITAWGVYKKGGNEKYEPSIIIGENCHIGEYNHITSINSIIIGDNVLMGRNVLITDHSHGNKYDLDLPPQKRPLRTKGEIIIGNNVWIGDKVVILSGVTIGDGAIVGANSVVTKNVEPMSVVGGIPADKIYNK